MIEEELNVCSLVEVNSCGEDEFQNIPDCIRSSTSIRIFQHCSIFL